METKLYSKPQQVTGWICETTQGGLRKLLGFFVDVENLSVGSTIEIEVNAVTSRYRVLKILPECKHSSTSGITPDIKFMPVVLVQPLNHLKKSKV